MNPAISTPTRWRPREHAAAARRARLPLSTRSGWQEFVAAPPGSDPSR